MIDVYYEELNYQHVEQKIAITVSGFISKLSINSYIHGHHFKTLLDIDNIMLIGL